MQLNLGHREATCLPAETGLKPVFYKKYLTYRPVTQLLTDRSFRNKALVCAAVVFSAALFVFRIAGSLELSTPATR